MHLSPRMVRLGNFVTGQKMTAGTMAVWVDGGEVLLVHSKHGERRWGFPGGVLGRREDPLDGACRELFEETGLRCAPNDLEIVGAHVQEHGRHLDLVYRVRLARPEEAPGGEDHFEIAEVRWFPTSALPPLRSEAERALELYPDLFDAR